MSDDADDSITFRVNNKCHPDFVIFKIRKSTKLSKMIRAYAKRYGVNAHSSTSHLMANVYLNQIQPNLFVSKKMVILNVLHHQIHSKEFN